MTKRSCWCSTFSGVVRGLNSARGGCQHVAEVTQEQNKERNGQLQLGAMSGFFCQHILLDSAFHLAH
jgi:hypothetical protein